MGPGQEVSFNDTVGQRTEAKGYQGAAAYNNGEVVQEIGGGVCQVSTTLYNAALKAGMKISMRRSHPFEPSYVTPGMDCLLYTSVFSAQFLDIRLHRWKSPFREIITSKFMRRNVFHEIWTLLSRKVLREKRAGGYSRVQETPFRAYSQGIARGHTQKKKE